MIKIYGNNTQVSLKEIIKSFKLLFPAWAVTQTRYVMFSLIFFPFLPKHTKFFLQEVTIARNLLA